MSIKNNIPIYSILTSLGTLIVIFIPKFRDYFFHSLSGAYTSNTLSLVLLISFVILCTQIINTIIFLLKYYWNKLS